MKHGTKVLFTDVYEPQCWRIGYFLFAASELDDPLRHYYVTTNYTKANLVNNFQQLTSSINDEKVTHSEVHGVIYDQIYEWSEAKEKEIKRLFDFYLRRRSKLEAIVAEPWKFHKKIIEFRISLPGLIWYYYSNRCAYAFKWIYNYIINPLVGTLIFDLVYVFILNYEYRTSSRELKKQINAFKAFNGGKLAYDKKHYEKITQEYEAKIDVLKKNTADIRENLLKSNRAFVTIIIAAVTLYMSYTFYSHKVDELTEQLEKSKSREMELKNHVKALEIELKNISRP